MILLQRNKLQTNKFLKKTIKTSLYFKKIRIIREKDLKKKKKETKLEQKVEKEKKKKVKSE